MSGLQSSYDLVLCDKNPDKTYFGKLSERLKE